MIYTLKLPFKQQLTGSRTKTTKIPVQKFVAPHFQLVWVTALPKNHVHNSSYITNQNEDFARQNCYKGPVEDPLVHTVDGRNPAPLGMCKNLVHSGIV